MLGNRTLETLLPNPAVRGPDSSLLWLGKAFLNVAFSETLRHSLSCGCHRIHAEPEDETHVDAAENLNRLLLTTNNAIEELGRSLTELGRDGEAKGVVAL